MASVRVETEGGVRTLTIDRPGQRNALDAATYRALSAGLAEAGRDPAVRAVVLTGAGGHFTAGNDLHDFQNPGPVEEAPGIALLRDLAGFEKPLLAAVEGVAVGIGCTSLLHCDFAFAGQGARFRMPFVPLGLVPEGSSTLTLPRLAGGKRAAELLLLGDEFPPAVALEAGLLTAVTPAGQALARAGQVATRLAALPQEAVRATKRLLRRFDLPAVREAIDEETRVFRQRLVSAEAQQAFADFFARKGR